MKLFSLLTIFLAVATTATAKKPCYKLQNLIRCTARPDCDMWRGKCGDPAELIFADTCLANIPKCTKYPPGVFKHDYPRRYNGEKSCYRESDEALTVDECNGVCDELFEENPQWGPNIDVNLRF